MPESDAELKIVEAGPLTLEASSLLAVHAPVLEMSPDGLDRLVRIPMSFYQNGRAVAFDLLVDEDGIGLTHAAAEFQGLAAALRNLADAIAAVAVKRKA